MAEPQSQPLTSPARSGKSQVSFLVGSDGTLSLSVVTASGTFSGRFDVLTGKIVGGNLVIELFNPIHVSPPCSGCGGAKYDPKDYNVPGGADRLITQMT